VSAAVGGKASPVAAAAKLGLGTPPPEKAAAKVWVVSVPGGGNISCPLTGVSISVGPARRLGYPRVTPLEENQQALVYRVRPWRREAFPLEKSQLERTRSTGAEWYNHISYGSATKIKSQN